GSKKPPKSSSGLPTELGIAPSPPDPTANAPPSNQMPVENTDPTMERDEYGAEMGKEARVWKIYVKETDRADAELVEGWNKSLDVILVFAALFSAVSTAFLIESSQKLQEDPADVTMQTLLAISQALSVLTNATQPAAVPSSSVDAVPFTPPRATVAVNTLWYLSLSLSVATSLLAMLAKDWCHSFLAGRTGHPYTQTIRRQQKWMMIEKWKMQELIMVLPSLIHLSLQDWVNQAKATLPVHSPGPRPEEKAITFALHWLVTSCEAPSAIDAALQAIAGANARIYRAPLEACNAALEISKRLVSGNIYKSTDRHVVSLYVRALSFLGSQDGQATLIQANAHSLGDVQVAVWNLQTQYDEQVAQLIGDGRFKPTDQNIEALGIGTSIASHILQHLNGIERDSTSLAESICHLLENHETLHPAAFQSLMNASELSLGFVEMLEKHDIIPLLEQTATGPSEELRIYALSLLWVLCALESYAPPDSEDVQNRLATQLRRCTAWGDPTAMKRALGYQLRDHWLTLNSSRTYWGLRRHEKYLSKVFECVIEAGDHITPSTNEAVGEELMEYKNRLELHNEPIRTDYRGLASFTAFGGHHTDAQPPPQPHLAVEITDDDELDAS
ncbi:unnamed protein product, partial [Rhizoctonia solani]